MGRTSVRGAACEQWTQSGLQGEPNCLCTQCAPLSCRWALPRSTHPHTLLARSDAFGISTGTLGTCCLPDADCGLGIVHPREKIGARLGIANAIRFLSTHLSLKETSCSKEPVTARHSFSFKRKGRWSSILTSRMVL